MLPEEHIPVPLTALLLYGDQPHKNPCMWFYEAVRTIVVACLSTPYHQRPQ